jgi:phage/plasmid-associated DNA primase
MSDIGPTVAPSAREETRDHAADAVATPDTSMYANLAPAPTPAEVAAIAWSAQEETSRRRHCPAVRGLYAFLRDAAHPYVTSKGDEKTNIIDQGDRVTYAMPPEMLPRFFTLLDACRAAGYPQHMSERQGTVAAPKTGIMLDYDIVTCLPRPALTERHYHRLVALVTSHLCRDVDLLGQLPPGPSGRRAVEMRLQFFFIEKTAAVELPAERVAKLAGTPALTALPAAGAKLYKYGFHILVPGVKVSRGYKKWLIREQEKDTSAAGIMRDLGCAGDPHRCLDTGSASVPTLFLGSCKRGGKPYALGAVYEVLLDAESAAPSAGTWAAAPVIRRVPPAEYEPYNLVHEMSLNYEAPPPEGRDAPFVPKYEFECRDSLQTQVEDWAHRTQGALLSAEELLASEHGLAELTLRDPQARQLHALLDLLPPEFCTARNRRRDVIYALANTSDTYRPIAEWFFQKNPGKWLDGGSDKLDTLWEEALRKKLAGGGERPLTDRSINFWAKEHNPQRYEEVMARSYFTILTKYVYDYGGSLEHYMVGKVLHAMLHTRFVVDVAYSVRGGQDYVWYEFVLPGTPMRAGEVWKWRRETDPDSLQVYLSDGFEGVMEQISDHLDERLRASENEDQAKYYKEIIRTFKGSRRRLFNDIFKNGVIRQARSLFRRRGFADDLDGDGTVRGVLNGVLVLGATTKFIDHFHEYLVSKYTKVCYYTFDPRTPMVKLVLKAFADVIPEPDAREKMLMFFAQSLNGLPKEGWMLIWDGGGQNGKTTVLRAVAKAIGEHYAKKFNIQIFVCDTEAADRPNSAFMVFKGIGFGYCEETNKAERLNTARLKQIVNPGEATGRDLNQKQETFTMTCNVVAATQFYFIIETADHGTWRRIGRYRSKIKFRKNPDPNNPYERKDDQRFVRSLPDEPEYQSAVLSLLVHYYERLEREFNGEIKNVRSPTIEKETEEYRVSQDATHRFISERVVLSEQAEPQPISSVASLYIEWYHANVDTKKLAPGVIVKDLENSILSKYLRPGLNRQMLLTGCRVLPNAEACLAPGEMYISEHEMRNASASQHDEAYAPMSDAEALRIATERWGAEWWAPRVPQADEDAAGPAAPDAAIAELLGGTAEAAADSADSSMDTGMGTGSDAAKGDNVGGASEEDWLFCNDDAALLEAERSQRKAPAVTDSDLGEIVDELIEQAVDIRPPARRGPAPSTDDLYA